MPVSYPVPAYTAEPQRSAWTTCDGVDRWYAPVLLTGTMVGERSTLPESIRGVLDVYERLESDDYVATLTRFYAAGLERYGAEWRYTDLPVALYAACELIQPKSYLEIGVRRGRSMAVVAARRPECQMVGFDYWKKNYAGMENPGADFVRAEVRRVGHRGPLELITGNSHQTVPEYLGKNLDTWFDLVTVDGDHSPAGAAQDLADVLPRLRIGGAVLFDDISHPLHPELLEVWRTYAGDRARFTSWEYTDLGYGVGIAVRKA